jgi:Ni/Co efflux regulator RcnB
MNKLIALGSALLLAGVTLAAPAAAQHRGADRGDRSHQDDRDGRDDRRGSGDRRDRADGDRRRGTGEHRESDRDDRSRQYGYDRARGDDRQVDRTGHGRIDRDRVDHRRDDRYTRDDRRYYATRHYAPAHRYIAPRGYRAGRWGVGARLPTGYYVSSYYVDHRPYRLRMPPRGYHWVRVDRDVYLVSIRSGEVLDVLYGMFR